MKENLFRMKVFFFLLEVFLDNIWGTVVERHINQLLILKIIQKVAQKQFIIIYTPHLSFLSHIRLVCVKSENVFFALDKNYI